MDLSIISQSDWETFQYRYPDAYAFLLHASLSAELNILRQKVQSGTANNWEIARHDELLSNPSLIPNTLPKSTKHKPDCNRAFKNYDSTCPRCRELSNGAKPREGWKKSRFNQSRPFAEVYCVCGKSQIWDGNCKHCGKMVYTD